MNNFLKHFDAICIYLRYDFVNNRNNLIVNLRNLQFHEGSQFSSDKLFDRLVNRHMAADCLYSSRAIAFGILIATEVTEAVHGRDRIR